MYVRKQTLYQRVVKKVAERNDLVVTTSVVREIVRLVAKLSVEDPKVFLLLLRLGLRKRSRAGRPRLKVNVRMQKRKGK